MTLDAQAGLMTGTEPAASSGFLASNFAPTRAARAERARAAREQYDCAHREWLQITFATQDAELWMLPDETRNAKARAHDLLLQAAVELLALDPAALPDVRFVRWTDPRARESRRSTPQTHLLGRKSGGATTSRVHRKPAAAAARAVDAEAEPVLLEAMERLEAEGRLMGIGGGDTYLPNLVLARGMNRGLPRSALGRAMRRLLKAGRIRLVVVGRSEHRGLARGLRIAR